MKTNYALILAATLSSGLVAQTAFSDDQLPPTPAAPAPSVPTPGAETPAGAPKMKSAPVTPAEKAPASTSELKIPASLTPGPALARQNHINVRGQAAINSEVVTRLNRGDRVMVLEEVTLKKPKLDEPAKWAKIALPTNTAVWVFGHYIDPINKTVTATRLNMRSGPGENYSVLGRLEQGAGVKEIETKGEWIKIEPPANAYAFVASHLLINEPEAPATPAIAAVEPPKVPEPPETPAVATPPEMAVVTPPSTIPPAENPDSAAPAVIATPPESAPPVTAPGEPAVATPAVAAPPIEAPAEPVEPYQELVKRVITREGIVKRSVSIQAPAYFVLESLDTGKTINYLHADSTNLVLKDFSGQRILVTGEEQLDERWPNTPVIYVEKLQAVP